MCWSVLPTPTPWKSWSDCCPGMLNWSGLQKKWRSTVKGKWVVLTADTLVKPVDFSYLAFRIESLWEKLQGKVESNHQQAAERSCWKLDDFNQNLMTPEGKVLKLSQQEFNL